MTRGSRNIISRRLIGLLDSARTSFFDLYRNEISGFEIINNKTERNGQILEFESQNKNEIIQQNRQRRHRK